ncbi:MAG: hypothetical protein HDR98_11555 [Bacteroides sp.]|nr:hypothetical protein [Bacteroides sp.]
MKLAIGMALILIMEACSETEPMAMDSVEKTRSGEVILDRSLEEALQYANDWFAQMEQGTRSANREIESVDFITTGVNTRSSDTDTLMYLVNYANNKGFALLGRHQYSRDIYAIGEDGQLFMSDTVYNKGLADFMALAVADAAQPNVRTIPIDTSQFIVPWKYSITRRVNPMLNENISKWNQSAPFNQCCPIINGKQGVLGCGPVAVGMLMAHYKWPKKMNEKTIPWTLIVDNNNYAAISRFLEDLAAPEYLNATYRRLKDNPSMLNPDARSIAATIVVDPTFMKLGYNTDYAFRDKSFYSVMYDVFSFMKSGYVYAEPAPILMTGVGEDGGHIWVVDGYVERVRKLVISAPWEEPEEADPLLHMVWGWGGTANGYFTYFRDEKQLSQFSTDNKDCLRHYKSLSVYGRYMKVYSQE